MASKRKKNICSEGPVKIVGINHGACLHHFLLMDGWKKEQFTVRIKTVHTSYKHILVSLCDYFLIPLFPLKKVWKPFTFHFLVFAFSFGFNLKTT
jgi:hypothetical protein